MKGQQKVFWFQLLITDQMHMSLQKAKPLTLLNGSNLLHLLEKHGHHAKIDLREAKKIIAEKGKAAITTASNRTGNSAALHCHPVMRRGVEPVEKVFL